MFHYMQKELFKNHFLLFGPLKLLMIELHSHGQIRILRQKILFIFDEPTTGLHFYDVEKLLKAFDALLAKGHSIVVVEHNPDVIRAADWIIDLGPEAGDAGGNLVFAGTPEELSGCKESYTAQFLCE